MANAYGFPNDDMNALQQLASGDCNLDMIYPYQFVQSEEVTTPLYGYLSTFPLNLKYTPVCKGTISGAVFLDGTVIQAFAESYKGNEFTFQAIGNPDRVVQSIEFNYNTGQITLYWNVPVGTQQVKLVVSYEYDYAKEVQAPEPVVNQVTIE